MIRACRRPTRRRFGALGSQASHFLTSWVPGPHTGGAVFDAIAGRDARWLGESSLLGVQLDDQLLLHRRGDLPPLRLAEHLRRQPVVVGLQPRGDLAGQLGGVPASLHCTVLGGRVQGDHVAIPQLIARDVHPAAVDRPVAVQDQLAGLAPRGGEAEPDEHVVEAKLEHPEQVLARHPGLARGLGVVDPELALEHAVIALGLLLLTQLNAVLALLLTAAAMIARRVRASLDAALVGQATLALEEQLLSLAAALLALWACVSSHDLDAPALSGTAAVVRLRGHVLDAGYLQTRRLQRANRGLTTGPGTLDEHLDLLKTVLEPLTRGGVGRHLGGERRRLARAFEAGPAGGFPGDDVALTVGQRHDRVVERRLDVGLADRNVLADAAAATPGTTRGGHYFLPAFFLPATCRRLGPLRVRALVFVFWPWTGRPRR